MVSAINNIHFAMLLESIKLLAADFQTQIEVLPNFVCVADEIALMFDDSYYFVDELLKSGLINKKQKAALSEMHSLLSQIDNDKKLWTIESLRKSFEWKNVRNLASTVLNLLEASSRKPSLEQGYIVFVK
jgi:hypothetical protein